jgi:hypothetical protein
VSRLRFPVSLFVACVLATLVTACGSSGSPACVVVDASHSTRYALPTYLERLEEAVLESADAGGSVAGLVATGEPLVESKVETVDFSGLTSNEDTGPRNAKAQEFLDNVNDAARAASTGAEARAPGSGIVAAISLVAGQDCASILVLSDGLESADARMKVDDILSDDGRQELLDQIEQRGRLPDLERIALDFPLGGYIPQGTGISKQRLAAVELFWQAYAARTSSSLSWRG